MSRRAAVAVVLVLAAAGALPQAQSARHAAQSDRPAAQGARPAAPNQRPPAPIYDRGSFSAATTAVLVDVVVRGKDGKPVIDLGAKDFELREDNIVQEVGSFTRVSRGAGIGVNVGLRDPNPPTVVTPPSGPPPPEATPEDDYPSVTALVFDALSAEAVGMCQKAALEYLPMSGSTATRVGVFTTDPVVRALQVYSDNPALVRNAVRRIQAAGTESKETQREAMNELRERRVLLETQMSQLGGAQQGGAAASAGASGIGQTTLQLRLAQGQMRMLQAFDTMDRDQRGFTSTKSLFAILQSLNEMPGRKTLIFFSEGLPASPALQAHLRSVVEAANRSNITVYAIDAAGLRVVSGTADTRRELEEAGKERLRQLGTIGDYTEQPMIRAIEKAEDLMRFDSQGGLAELAEDTGGFLVRDTNDLRKAFQKIDEDQRFHYLLTYSPKNQRFDGTFRHITVKVTRPGAQVFARKGYRALRYAPTLPVLDYEAPALAALDAARLSNGFPFETAAMNFPEPTRPGLAPLLVRLKTDVLTFDQDAVKRIYDAQATVVVRVRDSEGRVVHKMSQQYQLTGQLHELASAKRGEILFFRTPELASGLYTIESAVFDAVGARSSTRVATLEVPPPSRRLQMSSVVCVNRVERVAAETKDPTNPLYVGDMLLYPNGGSSYSRAGHKELTFFYTVYPGSSQGPLSAHVELQRNGQVLVKLPVELAKADPQGRIQQVGRLPLTAITPGTYQLHVVVTDGNTTLERTAYFQVVS
ncbi:MAG: VWA domain-containing protein [Vicinamibacteraceae bacterium]